MRAPLRSPATRLALAARITLAVPLLASCVGVTSAAAVRAPAPAAAYDTLRAQREGGAPARSRLAARAPRLTAVVDTSDTSGTPDTLWTTWEKEPPPRDYLEEARKGFTKDNREYQRLRVLYAMVSPLVGILANLLLLVTGLAQWFRDLALARAKGRWGRMLIFFSLYLVATFVILFPLAWFEGYALERRFGFATQTPWEWIADQVKSVAFMIVAFGVVPLLALAWFAVESSPRRWWLWLAAGTLPVLLASVVLQPLLFDPLFNKFTPLQDAELRQEILALGARAQVPARDVFEVDMSEKTTKVNAYVSGFGASQRIVLWDTALRRLSRDELLFVMGHEMGHYKLQHIWRGVLLYSLGAFAVFWLVAVIVRGTLSLHGERWRVRSAGDLAALPLLVAAMSLVSYLGAPLTNALSRRVEHEADVYALELTRDNDAGARSFLALARDNKSDPEPPAWVRLVLYSHPPLGDRIRFALDYRPWEKGEPNRAYKGD
jgi:Zn-dependent protease with chaperone function